jgi:serine protease Do
MLASLESEEWLGGKEQRGIMKQFTQFAIITIVLGAMAAAQATPAPAPQAPAVPAVPAVPAAPAVPAVPKPRPAPVKSYSYLGVTVRDVSPERQSELKLKDNRGVEIVLVDQDSPAGKAGLREGDVVLSFNGRNLQGSEEFRKLIREVPPGQTVELGVSRDGKPVTVKAQLADRHRVVVEAPRVRVRAYGSPRIEMPIFTTFSQRNGAVVENLTPQLGEVFGVKNGEGVLVRSVEKGSPADTAGLRAGDVIIRIGNERVERTSDWTRLMRNQKPGPVQLGVMRDKRQQTVSLKVPERTREQSKAMPGMEDFHLDMDMEEFGRNMGEFGRNMEDFERLQPDIDRAVRESQEKIQREIERSQREIERSQREAERAREQAERQRERALRDAERARVQAEHQAEHARERALHDAEKAREQAEREAERAQEQAERAQEQAEREQEQRQRENAIPNPPSPPAKPPQQ